MVTLQIRKSALAPDSVKKKVRTSLFFEHQTLKKLTFLFLIITDILHFQTRTSGETHLLRLC
jgi:hypothetical protein